MKESVWTHGSKYVYDKFIHVKLYIKASMYFPALFTGRAKKQWHPGSNEYTMHPDLVF